MKTLLITTDFSVTSMQAAEYSAQLAIDLKFDKICLYHSYDKKTLAITNPQSLVDTSHNKNNSLLALQSLKERIEKITDEEIQIETIANDDNLSEGVQNIITEKNIQLLAVGATGKSEFTQFVLGSNTMKLVKDCLAPVLIIPEDCEYKGIKKAVYACDLENVDERTPISTLETFITALKAELLVFHVESFEEKDKRSTLVEHSKLSSLIKHLNPAYHFAKNEDVADEIEEFMEDVEAQLLITLYKEYGFFEKLTHKSITSELSSELETPILVIKN